MPKKPKPKQKPKQKPQALPPLEPVRGLKDKPCASCKATPEIAAKMVAHGWQAVGTSGQEYIMIADAEAVASYMAAHGGDDEKQEG
jgi:hypothetical protein